MADLLRLLVAGRCGEAVTLFVGGKLTDGVRSQRFFASEYLPLLIWQKHRP